MIWPLSSGSISEAESISTMRRRQPGILEHAPRLLAGIGIAVGGARGDEAERGLAAGHAGGDAERARRRVGVADHAARHHVGRVADAAAGVREGGCGDAQRLGHGDDGDAGLILADARIVVDDGAGMGLEREIGGIAPAVRAGDDHAAPASGPSLVAVSARTMSFGRSMPSWAPPRFPGVVPLAPLFRGERERKASCRDDVRFVHIWQSPTWRWATVLRVDSHRSPSHHRAQGEAGRNRKLAARPAARRRLRAPRARPSLFAAPGPGAGHGRI